ncbi:lymphotoxin-beta [Psammomys obesus]|uniref:lymphotoxin-beta n=1 Tax=Psammomys obesus TaxID=48139 RepID=UPI002452BEC4|nr:lymphotoxin-beta [Psammomys obesus]
MGTRALQGLGGGPRGRGCLLLAVAGASSLATLLLAVPITVLAVLALVPQDQGRRVEKVSGSGAQAQRRLDDRPLCLPPSAPGPSGTPEPRLHPQRAPPSGGRGAPSPGPVAPSPREALAWVATPSPAAGPTADPGARRLPTGAADAGLSAQPPAAHLIGAWRSGPGLGWEASQEEAFLRSGARFSRAGGLALPRDGVYFVYCHVGYRGRAPPGGRPLTLRSALYRAGGASGRGGPELLLEGAETVSPAADPARLGALWYTSVGFGGLVQLRGGQRLYANISHPDMVDYRRGKTFFGAVMVA